MSKVSDYRRVYETQVVPRRPERFVMVRDREQVGYFVVVELDGSACFTVATPTTVASLTLPESVMVALASWVQTTYL